MLALLGGLKDDFYMCRKSASACAFSRRATNTPQVVCARRGRSRASGRPFQIYRAHRKAPAFAAVVSKRRPTVLPRLRAADDGDGDVVLRAEHVDLMRAELLANALIGSVFKVGRFGMAVEILKKARISPSRAWASLKNSWHSRFLFRYEKNDQLVDISKLDLNTVNEQIRNFAQISITGARCAPLQHCEKATAYP